MCIRDSARLGLIRIGRRGGVCRRTQCGEEQRTRDRHVSSPLGATSDAGGQGQLAENGFGIEIRRIHRGIIWPDEDRTAIMARHECLSLIHISEPTRLLSISYAV